MLLLQPLRHATSRFSVKPSPFCANKPPTTPNPYLPVTPMDSTINTVGSSISKPIIIHDSPEDQAPMQLNFTTATPSPVSLMDHDPARVPLPDSRQPSPPKIPLLLLYGRYPQDVDFLGRYYVTHKMFISLAGTTSDIFTCRPPLLVPTAAVLASTTARTPPTPFI
jgi:hypothetical protein